MGIETAIMIGMTLASGAMKYSASQKEAKAQEQQADIIEQETRAEADRQAKENKKFEARQKMAFLKSGVALTGSPLLTLEETQRTGRSEVEATKRRGAAESRLTRTKADITKNTGRASLVGSIGKSVGMALE